jgi:hypothetical protein
MRSMPMVGLSLFLPFYFTHLKEMLAFGRLFTTKASRWSSTGLQSIGGTAPSSCLPSYKYFAFSYYEVNGDNVTSYCSTTMPG